MYQPMHNIPNRPSRFRRTDPIINQPWFVNRIPMVFGFDNLQNLAGWIHSKELLNLTKRIWKTQWIIYQQYPRLTAKIQVDDFVRRMKSPKKLPASRRHGIQVAHTAQFLARQCSCTAPADHGPFDVGRWWTSLSPGIFCWNHQGLRWIRKMVG